MAKCSQIDPYSKICPKVQTPEPFLVKPKSVQYLRVPMFYTHLSRNGSSKLRVFQALFYIPQPCMKNISNCRSIMKYA